MIIQTEKEPIHTNLQNQKQKFTISSSPKAFHILMDGLYSDKIKSIVRELTSNAYDAHLDAGITKPFEITAPSALAPTFSIRDYGNSMEHEFVMQMYSSVFYSSKDQTNDQVGAFGLGSKSPFAYTDAFSLNTYRNGEMNLYSCYLDEDRAPNIVHVGSSKTNEPNGTYVTFEVSAKDVTLFHTAITNVFLAYWRMPPVVHHMDLKPPKLVYLNDELDYIYGMMDTPTAQYNTPIVSGLFFSQGNVWYPVPKEFTNSPYRYNAQKSEKIYEHMSWVDGNVLYNRSLMVMEVPLGTFNISASRESISLDKTSIASINHWIARTKDHIAQIIDAEYSKAKTRLDIFKTYRTLANTGFSNELAVRQHEKFNKSKGSSHVLELIKDNEDLRTKKSKIKSYKLGEVVPGYLYYREKDSISSNYSVMTSLTMDLEDIRVYVGLEDDMVRKASRLRKAYSNYQGKTKTLLCFRKDLPRWVRLLDLKPDQIHTISEIPDPGAIKGAVKTQKTVAADELFVVTTQRTQISAHDPHTKAKNGYSMADRDSIQRWMNNFMGHLSKPEQDVLRSKKLVCMYWQEYANDDAQHVWPWLKTNLGLDKIVDAHLGGEVDYTIYSTMVEGFGPIAAMISEHEALPLDPIDITLQVPFHELQDEINKEIERRKKKNQKHMDELKDLYPILGMNTKEQIIKYLRGNKCKT
jgi:hypothetical protein